jgi:hypothetical protein
VEDPQAADAVPAVHPENLAKENVVVHLDRQKKDPVVQVKHQQPAREAEAVRQEVKTKNN